MRGQRRGGYGGYIRRGGPYSGGGNYRNFQVPRNAGAGDRDGDVAMGGHQNADGGANPGGRPRFSPYLPPGRTGGPRGGGSQTNSPSTIGGGPRVGTYGNAAMGVGGDIAMSQTSGTAKWFRITIPNGKRFDREWIMTTLRGLMSYPLSPIHFHQQGPACVFYVNDEQAAAELKKCSGRAVAPGQGNLKLILITVPMREPPRLELTHETMPHLRSALERRFNMQTRSLDLSDLYNDAALNSELLYLVLGKPNVSMQIVKVLRDSTSAVNALVELNVSSNRLTSVDPLVNLVALMPNLTKLNLSNNLLRTEQELDRLKRLKLTELLLSGNPFADRFSDPKDYESAVRKRFRSLAKLDGKVLPKQIGFEVESTGELPASVQFFMGDNDNFKQLVLAFLEQYYVLYDAEKASEREKLLEAYHETARFSVSYFTNSLIEKQPPFRDYQDDSRNLRRVMDTQRRRKLLKQGRLSVVSTLAKLPRTKHDPSTMTVDVLLTTNTQLVFTVTGCFKEPIVQPSSSTSSSIPHPTFSPYRAFSRTFVAVPAGSGIAITNDILSLSNAPNAAYQRMRDLERSSVVVSTVTQATAATASVTVTAPVNVQVAMPPAVADTTAHEQLIARFAAESGMNTTWSRKCLEENQWNYDLAAHNYQQLRTQGVIPPEAYAPA